MVITKRFGPTVEATASWIVFAIFSCRAATLAENGDRGRRSVGARSSTSTREKRTRVLFKYGESEKSQKNKRFRVQKQEPYRTRITSLAVTHTRTR